jgi:hypothetical protein
MRVRNLAFVAMAAVAVATPARAALVLEYVQVPSIGAALSTAPALTNLNINATTLQQTIFLQVCLRDTLGAGAEYSQSSTVPWQTNAGSGGIGSLCLGAYFLRFDGYTPGVLVNPSPTIPTNINLVNGAAFSPASTGSNPGNGSPPPPFTIYGGLIGSGFESSPGTTPDGTNPQGARLALFNIRLQIPANSVGGSGILKLKDPNPTPSSADNAVLVDSTPGQNDGTFNSIDALLFGASFTNTFNLPFTVVGVPEPSSMALCGLAFAGIGYRKLRRKTAKA